MTKKISDLNTQEYFKKESIGANLYDLSISDTILFIYGYHYLGSMIDEGIFVEKLTSKIKDSLSTYKEPFISDIFAKEVVEHANTNYASAISFVENFIVEFEKPKEVFDINATYGHIDIPQYQRTTKKNSGTIH